MKTPTETPAAVKAASPARSHPGRWVLAVLVLLAVGGVVLWRVQAGSKAAAAAGPGGKGPEARKVPVRVEAVATADVPLVLEGLGTVTPLATVTVHSRVDGLLESLAFKEGGVVKKGDVLAQLDARPFRIALAQATATLQRDEAQLRNLKLQLSRNVTLREGNLIAQQQVDDQQALVDQAAGSVGIDQAAVDNARLQLDYTRVTAPLDGVAGIRQVDPGNLVRGADAQGLVVLTQLDPITVLFSLPQDELAHVAAAFAQGPLQVTAMSRDGRLTLATGTLTVIDNQINASTGTLRLKAQFDNPAPHPLWPNQFVKARLRVEVRKAALVVSAQAITRGQQGTFVYVVGADGLAQVRPVAVERIEGDTALLESGLTVGEQVVVEGQGQLKPGAAVDARGREGGEGGAPGGRQAKGGPRADASTEPTEQRGPPSGTRSDAPSGGRPGAPSGARPEVPGGARLGAPSGAQPDARARPTAPTGARATGEPRSADARGAP